MHVDTIIPMQILNDYNNDFSRLWRYISEMRELRGIKYPTFPDWCYIPAVGAFAGVILEFKNRGDNLDELINKYPPELVAALAAWRITKGIYRFDVDLFDELVESSLEGEIPSEVLFQLPEWCVYVELPESSYDGFFCFINHDIDSPVPTLTFLLTLPNKEIRYLRIKLGKWTINEALNRYFDELKKKRESEGKTIEIEMDPNSTEVAMMLVNLVLYICTPDADYEKNEHTGFSSRKGIKKNKTGAAKNPKIWEVGVRIGSVLRKAKARSNFPSTGQGTHASPRPHYRKAHWHSYRLGARNKPDEQKLVLKWLSPILVGVDNYDDSIHDGLPAVVHPITIPKIRE